MTSLAQIVDSMVIKAIDEIRITRDGGRENVESEQGKRCCLAEKVIYEKVRDIADEHFDSYELLAEGFNDVRKGKKPELKIILDPLDGTVYYVRQNSANPFPISIAVSIMDGEKYKDVKASAIGDLLTKEIWLASDGIVTRSLQDWDRRRVIVGGNEEHDPVWASDFYFPENAHLRTLLRHPKNPEWDRFECLNVGSVCEQVAKVACGELDLFYNAVGPKGLELAAMYGLVKQAGGQCLYLPTGIDIGELDFEFGERIPVVFSKDRESADKVLEAYNSRAFKEFLD